MIEINLVPDIKIEYLRSQHLRARVIAMSVLVSLAAVGVVVALAMYLGTQAIRNAFDDSQIKAGAAKLNSNNPDLTKLVTIQNQLNVLSDLNNGKQVTSRLFDLLGAINPPAPSANHITVSSVNLDPTSTAITIEGTASGFNGADGFKKTILNTNVQYTQNNQTATLPLSNTVTVSNTSLGADDSGKTVLRFTMMFTYPAQLFSNDVANVIVQSPTGSVDVTDSQAGVPASLFSQPASDVKGGN